MNTSKAAKSHFSLAGIAIFAIVVLHFAVSQFISYQTEKTFLQNEAVNQPGIKIETEKKFAAANAEAVKPDAVENNESVFPPVQREESRIAPSRTMLKKTEQPRESKAERLRRAEKLLTGV